VLADLDHLGDDELAEPRLVVVRKELDHRLSWHQAGRQAQAEKVRVERVNLVSPSMLLGSTGRQCGAVSRLCLAASTSPTWRLCDGATGPSTISRRWQPGVTTREYSSCVMTTVTENDPERTMFR
jgi:hypothetical protein